MEAIEEADVFRAQQIFVNQLATVWCNGKVLPRVEVGVNGVLDAHDHVLDADAKFALLVEARFIGDAHSLNKLEFVATAYSIGALMHIEIAAYTMTGSVLVVETSLPKVLAGEDIHVTASDSAVARPGEALKVDCAKEDARVGFLLESSRLAPAEMPTTSDIGSTIQVLATRVE